MPPLIDTLLISDSEPRSAYMWPEIQPGQDTKRGLRSGDDIFVFQYWPEQVTDSENPRYAEKEIPGASHPLYQWTGGGAREIAFTAVFTSEVDENGSIANAAVAGAVPSFLLPSARYTVNVAAALAKLKTYTRGDYAQSGDNKATKPPRRMWLCLEGSGLGGNTDAILTILKSAPITYEAWFPNGTPRVATVQLTFAEVIQRSGSADSETSQIAYLGSSSFVTSASKYKYRGTVDRVNG
jgi:hypothetical protein